MAQAKTQAQRRRSFTGKDQYKRPWAVCIELETGDPTVPISAAGWMDPLRTPGKYLTVDVNNPRAVFCDLRRWYLDQKQAQREYKALLHLVGEKLYREQYDEKASPTGRMVEEAGPPPLDPALILAAAKGDAELLGLPGAELTPETMKKLNWEARSRAANDAEDFDEAVGDLANWNQQLGVDEDELEAAAQGAPSPHSAQLPSAPAGHPQTRQYAGGKRTPKRAKE